MIDLNAFQIFIDNANSDKFPDHKASSIPASIAPVADNWKSLTIVENGRTLPTVKTTFVKGEWVEIDWSPIRDLISIFPELDNSNIISIHYSTVKTHDGQHVAARLNRQKTEFDACIPGIAENASFANSKVRMEGLKSIYDNDLIKSDFLSLYYQVQGSSKKIYIVHPIGECVPCNEIEREKRRKEAEDRKGTKVRKALRLTQLGSHTQSFPIIVKNTDEIYRSVIDYGEVIERTRYGKKVSDQVKLQVSLSVNNEGVISLYWEDGTAIVGTVIAFQSQNQVWVSVPNRWNLRVDLDLNNHGVNLTNCDRVTLPKYLDERLVKMTNDAYQGTEYKLIDGHWFFMLVTVKGSVPIAKLVDNGYMLTPMVQWSNTRWTETLARYEKNILTMVKPFMSEIDGTNRKIKEKYNGLLRHCKFLITAALPQAKYQREVILKLLSDKLLKTLISTLGEDEATNLIIKAKIAQRDQGVMSNDLKRIIHNL